jgi:uncharacterized membrane protein YqjE
MTKAALGLYACYAHRMLAHSFFEAAVFLTLAALCCIWHLVAKLW